MARSVVVACLAFAGVWLLASPGWALLAGACLVFVLWRREPGWRGVGGRAAPPGPVPSARAAAGPPPGGGRPGGGPPRRLCAAGSRPRGGGCGGAEREG